MVSTSPGKRAERCSAIARSTAFAGERANAIAQGTRIAEAAGLSLDLFDIPGRQRAASPRATIHVGTYSGSDASEAMRRFTETMAEVNRQAFDLAVEQAKQRDRMRTFRNAQEDAIRRAQATFEKERAEDIRRVQQGQA